MYYNSHIYIYIILLLLLLFILLRKAKAILLNKAQLVIMHSVPKIKIKKQSLSFFFLN